MVANHHPRSLIHSSIIFIHPLMCGIFGAINFSVEEQSEFIFKALAHRGPNERGFFSNDNVELLHTRLAIQDLNITGRQPMHYKGLSIVFNGEIYNHLELRERYGLFAESHSDTLTLLMLYEKFGIRMLQQLDGMFAFALYDAYNQELFLARDRAGKKPLYVYQKGHHVGFSSELPVLQKIFKPQINYPAASAYLYLGYNYRQATPYQEIKEVENGNYLKINTKTLKKEKVSWFNIEIYSFRESQLSYQDNLEKLDEILQVSVKRRIDSSDLDVGSFLSGGIDSGLITAIAARHRPALKTFTVKIQGSYDESLLAQKVADRYKTQHTVVDISFDNLRNDIEQILTNYGEPFCDSSAIPSFYVAKAAKEHVTVVLNGDGADELFGGYRRYVPFRYHDFFKSGVFTRKIAQLLTMMLPIAHEKKSNFNYIYRLLKFSGYSNILQLYNSATSDIFVGFEDQFLIQPELHQINQDLKNISDLNLSPLKKLLIMDFQTILFNSLLPKMDIATMAHSLEGRSPFLSKELLEFAPGLEDNYKIRGLTTKFILRDLAKKYLPSDLVDQPKRGFEIPLKGWVNHQLKDIIHDYLLSQNVLYPSLIKKDFIHKILVKPVGISEEKRAKILYNVFALEVWYKNYQNSNANVRDKIIPLNLNECSSL